MFAPNVAAPNSPDRAWVICLCADWCGVCRDYRVVIERAAERHPAFRFAWIDVEDHSELVGDLDIDTFPTLMVLDDSGVHFAGAITPQPATLSRLLDSLITSQSPVAAHEEVSGRLASQLPSRLDLQIAP